MSPSTLTPKLLSDAAEKLKPMLTSLPTSDQVALADWLYGHAVGDTGSMTGDPELDEILRTRTEAILNGTAKGRPGPEVMAELRERFK